MRQVNGISQRTSRLNKARQIIDKGRCDDAINILHNLIAESKDDAEARYFLALAYLKLGQSTLALEELIRVAVDKPDWAAAHALRGEALRALGRLDEAIAYFRHALSLNGSDVVALTGLGYLLHSHHLAFEEACTLLEEAVSLEPSNANAHMMLATVLFSLERTEDGLRHGRKALKLKPTDASLCLRFAALLQLAGDKQEATRLLEKACDIDPAAGASYLLLAGTQRFTEAERWLVQRMEAAQELPMSIPHRDNLHFALGKAYDDLKEWDRAFMHYEKGNRLVRASYEAKKHSRETKLLSRFFSPSFFQTQALSGREEAPIFIIGMPRSGSTLLEQILAAHPDVYSVGESRGIMILMNALCREGARSQTYPFCLERVSVEQYRRTAEDYLSQARQGIDDGGLRILDKQLFNFGNLGMIRATFPNARILHTKRHPLDTCLSCYFQRFESNKALGWSYDLRSTGLFYRRYRELMRHWRRVLPMDILDVEYSDMVAQPEAQARRILAFCGLEWNPAVLAFHQSRSVVQTASHEQVRQPIYTRSVGRWTHYAAHLQPLVNALGGELEECRADLGSAGLRLRRGWHWPFGRMRG